MCVPDSSTSFMSVYKLTERGDNNQQWRSDHTATVSLIPCRTCEWRLGLPVRHVTE